MADPFLDAPWWLLVCLVVAGTAIALMGNSRLSKGLRNAGLGVVLLALLLATVKFTIDTTRKKADRDARAMVAAAVNGDWSTFQSLLAPTASLSVLNTPPLYATSGQITKAAQEATQRIHLRDAHIRYLEVTRRGPIVSAEMNLWTEQDLPEGPLPSSWRFEFEQTPKGWVIVRVIAENIGNLSPDDIQREMPGGR